MPVKNKTQIPKKEILKNRQVNPNHKKYIFPVVIENKILNRMSSTHVVGAYEATKWKKILEIENFKFNVFHVRDEENTDTQTQHLNGWEILLENTLQLSVGVKKKEKNYVTSLKWMGESMDVTFMHLQFEIITSRISKKKIN